MYKYIVSYLTVTGLFIYQIIREDIERERTERRDRAALIDGITKCIGDYAVVSLHNGFYKKGYLVSVTDTTLFLDTTKPKHTAFGWMRTEPEFNIVNVETVLLSTITRVNSIIKREDLAQYAV